MCDDAKGPRATPHRGARRIIRELPITTLFGWLCSALAPTLSACCPHTQLPFPLALSSSLIRVSSTSAPSPCSLLVRPRAADCLYVALLRLLASDAERRRGLAADKDPSLYASALQDWTTVLALVMPLTSCSPSTLDRAMMLSHGASADAPRPLYVPQHALLHTSDDGQARRLLVFATLLGLLVDPFPHTPLPWLEHGSSVLSVPSRTLASLFLTSSAGERAHYAIFSRDAAGHALPSVLLRLSAIHQERTRLRQVVKRLVRARAITMKDTSDTQHSCESEDEGWLDWLEWMELRALRTLAAHGDAHPVLDHDRGTRSGGDDMAVVMHYLRGAVHHLIGTVLDGAAAEVMERVLLAFLAPPPLLPAAVAAAAATRGDGDHHARVQDAIVRHRLDNLAHHPERAFMISQTSVALHRMAAATVSASLSAHTNNTNRPSNSASCFLGPVAASHVLPTRAVFALPCEMPLGETEAGTRTPCFYWSSQAILQDTGEEVCVPSPSGMDRQVLLLRVDPDGDWLPPAETTRNTQTFYTYYANDADPAGADAKGEYRFAVLEAQQSGRRDVGQAAPADSSTPATPSQAALLSPTHAQTEHLVKKAWSWLSRSTEKKTDQSEVMDPDVPIPHLMEATLRLFIYALLISSESCANEKMKKGEGGLFVIVTPERVPATMKLFGIRHGAWLRQWVHTQNTNKGAEAATRVPSSAEPIYLVDNVLLEYFESLQLQIRRHHMSPCDGAHPDEPVKANMEACEALATDLSNTRLVASSAIVLCRDCIRTPQHPADALLCVRHVSLTTSAQLFARPHPSALSAYMRDPSVLFTHRGTTIDGTSYPCGEGQTRTSVPPSLHHQQHTQLFCLLELGAPQFDEVPPMATQRDEEDERTLVVVAPTPELAALYESCLRRTAATLLSVYTQPFPEARVLVRGGGAYLIAMAAQLRHASDALSGAHDPPAGSLQVRGDARDGLVFTQGTPTRRCLAWLWRLLSTALLAVPLSLWESASQHHHITNSASATRVSLKSSAAQRAEWALAVDALMRSCVSAELPASPAPASENTPMKPTFASVTTELTTHAKAIEDMLACFALSGDADAPACGNYPLVEPVEPNRRVIRGALELLLLSLTVSAT